ncbi:plasmid pRiA4b ORF-3 family protein [Halalkalibacter sp. AB-rgal2]|uniref:plasmid pRiA4b ORF-3 family protein n=1 Tax=Halalkalibacter sp. AB-rgal2 TaxID=3242695 RepID=UPI00359DE325
MIYQLKITLSHIKPPIWRRILIDSESTFEDLDELIQMMFDWEDMHLHQFEMRKTNGQRTTTFIEPTTPDDVTDNFQLYFSQFGAFNPPLNTENERLKTHFKKEKDRCIYTYDLGEDWQHEIILEKIVQPQPEIEYPYCVKAMRAAPGEDPFSESIQGEVNNEELREMINIQLAEHTHILNEIASEHAHQNKEAHLLDLTQTFNQMALWEFLNDDQIIVIWVPIIQDYAYCSVLGAMKEEFGLACYLGNDGLKALHSTLNGEFHHHEAILFEQRSILLSLSDRNELEPEDHEFIKAQNASFRGKKQWPMFRSFKPAYYPWFINDEEIEILNGLLEQMIEIAPFIRQNEYNIPTAFEGPWFTRKLDQNQMWYNAYIEPSLENPIKQPAHLFINELDLMRVKKLKVADVTLEIGSFFASEPVQSEEDDRPFFPFVVIAMNKQNGMITFIELLQHDNLEENLQKLLLKLIHQLLSIPKQIEIESEPLHRALTPLIAHLPIKMNHVEALVHLEDAKEMVLSSMEHS